MKEKVIGEETEMVVNLKKGNKEPIEKRIQELEDSGLNNDCAILIAIGERGSKELLNSKEVKNERIFRRTNRI